MGASLGDTSAPPPPQEDAAMTGASPRVGSACDGELMAGWLVKSPPLESKKPIFNPVTPVRKIVKFKKWVGKYDSKLINQ